MTIPFYKYQGAGNDFVIIDNRNAEYSSLTQAQIEFLCNRKFGIGADGLMLLESSETTHFKMVYFNSDGRESSMCGNGGRCITAFAHALNVFETQCEFEAIDGLHKAIQLSENQVKLEMINVPEVEQISNEAYFLNTGSPHYVVNNCDLKALNIITEAHKIRYNNRFKAEGTNVNFISGEPNTNQLQIRTYERGVENETLACGTGVTAAAIAFSLYNKTVQPGKNEYEIQAEGGDLRVEFQYENQQFTNIWLSGPATFVFKGTISL